MQKKFNRSYDSLDQIFEFTERILSTEEIEQSLRFPVHFVMEELFTNMVKYNPGNSNDILLDVDASDHHVTVSITDYDVHEFDVTADRKVDTESALEKRPIGGLGLHLIKKMVDTIEYDYNSKQSTVTFTKGPD
jgi:serine/threonine-protein kinase RsbW